MVSVATSEEDQGCANSDPRLLRLHFPCFFAEIPDAAFGTNLSGEFKDDSKDDKNAKKKDQSEDCIK